MNNQLIKICSTFFYIGFFPFAPGSMASLLALVLWALLHQAVSLYIVLMILITIAGFLFSGDMEKITKSKDPSCVVIDEVAGGMIAFLGLPLEPAVLITAYFLFRAFDMFKIFPVDRFEKMEGSIGIMMDDLFAGFYTCVVMHIALKLVHLWN